MIQSQRITTFYDMVEYLLHYGSMDPQKQTVEDCRRAVLNGYKEFNASHNWSFLFCRGRINTVPPYAVGSVQYTDATRTATLTGGTWPAWAPFGDIRINGIPYSVATAAGQDLVLSKRTPIGHDLPAGTPYLLYREKYTFPIDYQASYDMVEYASGYQCRYVANADLLYVGRVGIYGPAKPFAFAVTSDPNYLGAMCAWMHPIPDAAYAFDFVYHRRPRYIVTTDYSTGTVGVTAGTDVVTGNGTGWRDVHVGSIIRLGSVGEKLPPTSLTGSYPYRYERTVVEVTGETTLKVDEVVPEDLANVLHRISDPIDVEDGACDAAFHRECERQIRLIRRIKPLYDGDSSEEKAYAMAYLRAREADKRSLTTQVAGGGPTYRRRLADMPFNWS